MSSNKSKDEMFFYSVKEKEKINKVMKHIEKKIDSLIQENLKLRKEITKAIEIVKKNRKNLRASAEQVCDIAKRSKE